VIHQFGNDGRHYHY